MSDSAHRAHVSLQPRREKCGQWCPLRSIVLSKFKRRASFEKGLCKLSRISSKLKSIQRKIAYLQNDPLPRSGLPSILRAIEFHSLSQVSYRRNEKKIFRFIRLYMFLRFRSSLPYCSISSCYCDSLSFGPSPFDLLWAHFVLWQCILDLRWKYEQKQIIQIEWAQI